MRARDYDPVTGQFLAVDPWQRPDGMPWRPLASLNSHGRAATATVLECPTTGAGARGASHPGEVVLLDARAVGWTVLGVRSPLRWFGSKAAVAAQVVEHLGDHVHYVEVFTGSAAVLFAKPRSRIETLNDVDDDVVNLFRVLGDPDTATMLTRRCAATVYARREFVTARSIVESGPAPLGGAVPDRVERAWAFLVAVNFSVSRSPHSTGWSVAVADPGGSIPPARWRATVARLEGTAARLEGVQVDCSDWRDALTRYDRPSTVFYLDPPYHPELRSGGRYRHEMTAGDHDELIETLLGLRGRAVLSGFAHPTHDRLTAAGWGVVHVTAPATRRRSTQPAETLWVAPPR